MPERVPRLVLIVLACRRHLVVFFSRRHTYLLSSSSRQPPRVGVYHCLGRPRHSIVSMGVRRPLRCHRPRRRAVGSPRRPSSVASTDVGVCALKDKGPSPLERKPPPPKSTLSTESKESTTRRSSSQRPSSCPRGGGDPSAASSALVAASRPTGGTTPDPSAAR